MAVMFGSRAREGLPPKIRIHADNLIEPKRVSLFQLVQQYAGPPRRLDDLRRRSGAAELRRGCATIEPLTGFRHPWGRSAQGGAGNPSVQSNDPISRAD